MKPSVDVLGADPDLGEHLDVRRRAAARQRGAARVLSAGVGPWLPSEAAPQPGGLGMLVLEGVLIRQVVLADRRAAEPLGPGDLIRPRETAGDRYAMLPSEVSWRVLESTRFALLDRHFVERMCDFPEVIDQLVSRVAQRLAGQAQRLAIVQQPRLSARLYFLLWHLADRFGRVGHDGVILQLPLSHQLLADIVCAQRPPVSRALKELERASLIGRREDGYWWLGGQAPAGAAAIALAAPPVGV